MTLVRSESLPTVWRDSLRTSWTRIRSTRTITTDYPDAVPFRMFAHDADAHRELHTEFLNRGCPVNDGVLGELVDLRAEHAAVLGYGS